MPANSFGAWHDWDFWRHALRSRGGRDDHCGDVVLGGGSKDLMQEKMEERHVMMEFVRKDSIYGQCLDIPSYADICHNGTPELSTV
uniref:Uncharacterized protein n=1 Tax=Candidatus Methanogaster sp. ANME-2c ERB4 TaxID=2759911 RepID=A0A7G9Y152_9EURY|nr:hypothetical protein AHFDIGBM_00003 [Methanosarcinales archaeon ANME-2c ERB4]